MPPNRPTTGIIGDLQKQSFLQRSSLKEHSSTQNFQGQEYSLAAQAPAW